MKSKLSLFCVVLLCAHAVAAPRAAKPQPPKPQSSKPQSSKPQTALRQNKTTTVDADALLARYQAALDQIAQGHTLEARVLLEDGIRRFGEQPELTLLLAYLLQRDGRPEDARQRLLRIAPSSPLASAYAAQLRGQKNRDVAAETIDAPTGVVAPGARLAQTDARLAKLEQFMAQLVNAERKKAGLELLTFNAELADVARAHAAEMRDQKYFAHESPTASRRQPMDRYRAALGRTPRVVAENIYRAWGTQHRLTEEDIRSAHAALMKSPGHRANILFNDVRRIGIGIVANAQGDIWLTQMFDRPR